MQFRIGWRHKDPEIRPSHKADAASQDGTVGACVCMRLRARSLCACLHSNLKNDRFELFALKEIDELRIVCSQGAKSDEDG